VQHVLRPVFQEQGDPMAVAVAGVAVGVHQAGDLRAGRAIGDLQAGRMVDASFPAGNHEQWIACVALDCLAEGLADRETWGDPAGRHLDFFQDVNLWKFGARFSLKAATPSFDSAVS
jgi:hypothetical protein